MKHLTAAWARVARQSPPPEVEFTLLPHGVPYDSSPVALAHVEGRVVGFVNITLWPGYSADISTAWVAKPWRRKGIASRLLDLLKEQHGSISHSKRRTTNGDAWARSRSGQGENLPVRLPTRIGDTEEHARSIVPTYEKALAAR